MSAGSSWASYQYFKDVAAFVCVGSFPQLVKFSADAYSLARVSFAISAGLLAFSISLSALMAGRFRAKAAYSQPFLAASIIGIGMAGLALGYYRQEMHSMGLRVGEFLAIMRDSRYQLALNPLSRSLLFAGALTLLAGGVRGVFSPVKGGGR